MPNPHTVPCSLPAAALLPHTVQETPCCLLLTVPLCLERLGHGGLGLFPSGHRSHSFLQCCALERLRGPVGLTLGHVFTVLLACPFQGLEKAPMLPWLLTPGLLG